MPRLVAPNPDMVSASIENFKYDLLKDDKYGRVVDCHDNHVEAFLSLGFKHPWDIPAGPITELKTIHRVTDLRKEIEKATEVPSEASLHGDGPDVPDNSEPAPEVPPEVRKPAKKKH